MKDAYSFDIDEAAARVSYNKMFVAYLRTFARMGLKAIPMAAETGPIGGDLSHEFIILAETGESGVFCNKDVLELPVPGEGIDYEGDLTPHIRPWTELYAATEDVHDAARFEREVPADKRLHTRGIEVGQIFYFGTKYSDAMKAAVTGADGVERPVHGGSYGVGVSRLVGAIIEAFHDDSQGRRGAIRRPRPAPGSEVRDRRPHRHSLAGSDRAERPCRGQGRGQETLRRQPRIDERRRCGQAAGALSWYALPAWGGRAGPETARIV
jgi:prolyl-tRNA synthetase